MDRRRKKRRKLRKGTSFPVLAPSDSEEDIKSSHSESGSDDSEGSNQPSTGAPRKQVKLTRSSDRRKGENVPSGPDPDEVLSDSEEDPSLATGSQGDQPESGTEEQIEMLSDADDQLREGTEDTQDHGNEENESDNETHSDPEDISASDHGDDQSSDDNVERDLVDSGDESGNESSESENNSSEEDDLANSSEEEAEEADQDGNQLIYDGAQITLLESCLAIFNLAVSEHLSGSLLARIIQLVALYCPVNSICKRTLHTLKKFFSKVGTRMLIFHYFCSPCGRPLKDKREQCKKCKVSGDFSMFIEMPIFHQLQTFLLRPRFLQDLQYRFQPGRDPTKISDIYDGRLYKEQSENNGFLSNPHNISFMWWSDGLQIFKSSTSSSIWPVCLVINELPYHKRILPRNIILSGIWFGRAQPNPNLILKPLEKSLEKFSSDGYRMKLPDNSEITVKGKILCATCDLPAKAKFMRMKQSGTYSCAKCLIKGGTFRTEKKGNVTVFPYQPNVQLRTPEHMAQCAQQAVTQRSAGDKKASVFGVKGPSLLFRMVPDIIRCMAIDILHGAFLGVCKWLTHLWFDPKYARCPWSLHASLDIIDARIRQMKPPSFVQRPLRNIKEALPHWKASEFKLFLLYYSVPVLFGIMTDEYFKHHCKLVSAISLLCQDSISMDDIRDAEDLLKSYLADFANLYHIRFFVMNFHQLIHLPSVVLDVGPLWVSACFFLESFNGVLAKLFHGTRHPAAQICSSINLVMEMPLMIERLPIDSVVKKFCQEVMFKKNKCKIMERAANNVFVVGKYSDNHVSVESSRQHLRTFFGYNPDGVIQVFYRLKKEGILFYSSEYSRSNGRKDSTFVSFRSNDSPCFGRVVRFVKWQDCNPQCVPECQVCPVQFFFIVKEYSRQFWYPHDNPEIRFPHLCEVKATNDVLILPLESLTSLVFYMKVDQVEYIATPLNSVEPE